MKTFAFLLAATFASQAPVVFGQQPPPAADPVVVTIGADKITQSEFERIVATLPEQARTQAKTPEGRRQLAEQLVELMVLAKEAKARKLDQNPVVQTRLTIQADQVLASAVFQSLGTSDEAAIRAYYEAHKSEMDQIHARHILIRFQGSAVPLRLGQKDLTDAEALEKAKDLRAKILAGAKFTEVAQAESDDVGSGANGGDLDTFGHGAMVPEFEKAAFALPVGQVSEPVRSAFGYHLILVETHAPKSFDEARPDIEKSLGPEAAEKAVDDLKSKAGVVFSDTYFGKSAEAATTGASAPPARAGRSASPELPFEAKGLKIADGGKFSTDDQGNITRTTGMTLQSLYLGKLEIPLQSTSVSSDNMIVTKDYGTLQIQANFSTGKLVYLILVTPEQEQIFKSLCRQGRC